MSTITQDASPLEGLLAELRRQRQSRRDLIADTRRISFETDAHIPGAAVPLPALALNIDLPDGAEAYGVNRHAHQQIAEHVGVPWKLYERLMSGDGKKKAQPDLLANLANGLLSREPNRRMVRTLDGNVRAFLSDRYRPRDNWELMESVYPVLAERPGIEFAECKLSETRMYVKVRLPEFERPVTPAVGDVVQGGVIISNSEVGSGALLVAPYTTILRCLNGMVHTEYGQRSVHLGGRLGADEQAWDLWSDSTLALDDAAFAAKVKDTVRAVVDQTVFDRIVEQMRDLAGTEIGGSPVPAVEILVDRLDLSETEGESILDNLIRGGELTAWGYVNAVTATARELEDADRKVELQTLAGRMTSAPESWVPALAARA